jgi:hypothetical protein
MAQELQAASNNLYASSGHDLACYAVPEIESILSMKLFERMQESHGNPGIVVNELLLLITY